MGRRKHRGIRISAAAAALFAVSAAVVVVDTPMAAAQETAAVDLDVLPGGTMSTAVAINNDGTVVGYANNAAGRPRAVRWNRAGDITDLGPLGELPTAATGITDHGTIIGTAGEPSIAGHPVVWRGTRRAP